MELDALAQLERPGEPVVGHAPGLGQLRLDVHGVLAEDHQVLEHLDAGLDRLAVGRLRQVERNRVAPAAPYEGSAGGLFGRPAERGQQAQGQNHSDHEFAHTPSSGWWWMGLRSRRAKARAAATGVSPMIAGSSTAKATGLQCVWGGARVQGFRVQGGSWVSGCLGIMRVMTPGATLSASTFVFCGRGFQPRSSRLESRSHMKHAGWLESCLVFRRAPGLFRISKFVLRIFTFVAPSSAQSLLPWMVAARAGQASAFPATPAAPRPRRGERGRRARAAGRRPPRRSPRSRSRRW